ncbi:hypothetical protein Ahy_B01g052613 [Arachis hypogaea]|uniref:FAR1 domain-containing protein n=1 Tax=Arachis hypogaea TaxID=3818 RepID=A0A445APW7_ARAHY|nr:hypothetical protein Ahy_B01g052613 [Arachis hypogaea]
MNRMQEFLNFHNAHVFGSLVEITFKTLEEARKFYKDYSKLASFSTKIKNTTRKGDEIKNHLITCSRERK